MWKYEEKKKSPKKFYREHFVHAHGETETSYVMCCKCEKISTESQGSNQASSSNLRALAGCDHACKSQLLKLSGPSHSHAMRYNICHKQFSCCWPLDIVSLYLGKNAEAPKQKAIPSTARVKQPAEKWLGKDLILSDKSFWSPIKACGHDRYVNR